MVRQSVQIETVGGGGRDPFRAGDAGWPRLGKLAVGELEEGAEVCLRDGLRSDLPAFELVLGNLAAVAKMERVNLATRVKSSASCKVRPSPGRGRPKTAKPLPGPYMRLKAETGI